MIDNDNSFLRLRDNFNDAKNLSESPQLNYALELNTQVHLCAGETYFQISNSPTSIIFNGNYEVFLVDECGVELEDVTSYIFIEEFFDSNAIKQIKWEFVNDFEYYYKHLSLRFKNTVNNDTWYTNLFISTADSVELTTRFDYKNYQDHYGTEYTRADFYQSIRLGLYFRNPVNESEREEYHEISTNRTVPQRNIRKIKQRYILNEFDGWTTQRLETLLSSSEIYIDTVRAYSTAPIEFLEPEMDSNFSEGEMIVNKDFNQTPFVFEFQIFSGLQITFLQPEGAYILANLPNDFKAGFNLPIELNTGNLTVHKGDGTVLQTFTEASLSVSLDTFFGGTGLTALIVSNGDYYINFTAGLISSLGIQYEGIQDMTTWAFTVQDGQFNKLQFNNSQFLTN